MPSSDHAATAVPGPAALGRGCVVAAGQPAPGPFADVTRVVVDDEVLAHPSATVAVLHDHWVHRRPVVIELAADNDALRRPETDDRPPHRLPFGHTFERERLHFLIWANTYDARRGDPVWWHGVLAQRRGAAASDVADARVPGPDTAVDVWVDGGPRGWIASGPGPDGGTGARVAGLPVVHRESVQLGRLTLLGGAAPRDDLAPDQLAAVTHPAGPARVIAPAGSGKTRVLTARLRHLLRDRRYEPEIVTAVAYNTRAAGEMRERTGDLPADVRTIHSLALAICRAAEPREVIEERQVRGLLDDLVSVARIPNQDPYQPYLEALSETRLALADPAAVEATRDDVPGFSEMFDRYRAVLTDKRLLDFDEQIYRAIELLCTRPDLRRKVQRSCTHLLVDEFQDLTPAFLLLLRLCAGPSLQVFGVGDDDQVIYSYAGATPDFLLHFDRYFPGAAHHALEVNYRCPVEVVDAATHLLSHNRQRLPKTIRAAPHAPEAEPPGTGTAAGAPAAAGTAGAGTLA